MATILVVLFISHRIAGPLYKFESSLERIANGDVSFDIHFRRNDEMKKLAEVFNTASRSLNNLICDIKSETTNLNLILNGLKTLTEKLPSEQQKDLENDIVKLEDASNKINEKLNAFRLR
jgi:methyl-accepting chemotaxis protein